MGCAARYRTYINTARILYHIPYGYRKDAVGRTRVQMYGGCTHMRGYVRITYGRTGDVRLDIAQIPHGYHGTPTSGTEQQLVSGNIETSAEGSFNPGKNTK